MDSLPDPVPGYGLYQMEASPDGRHVYLSWDGVIRRYDLIERRVSEEVFLPAWGRLSVSADGQRLYRMEYRGGRLIRLDGLVHLFASDLTPMGTIDLSAYLDDGAPPTVRDVAESPDGERLYLVAGTEWASQYGPLQRARVFVVRLSDRSVERVIPLGRWGPNRIYATNR